MIWLLRHADAQDGTPDAERPLSAKGERQAGAVGAALATLGIALDRCATSPKVRARETARLACERLGVEPVVDDRLGGGPFDPREVAGSEDGHVLLVGHDPDFSLAIHAHTGAQVRMRKGGIAGIDRGEIKVLLRPEELAALAGAR